MKDEVIYKLWLNGATYERIASAELPSNLSLKRIRNIIYMGEQDGEHSRQIYALFKLKFQELQDVNEAIRYVYENQPPKKAPCVKHIRKIINKKLKR